MSLWRQRSAIERAVAGQLGTGDEAKLRAHLRGCNECRRYYDEVSVQARILAGDPHSTAAASQRELARLMGALNPAEAPAAAPLWWPRFALAAGVMAAVVFGVISWRGSIAVAPSDQIALRGGGPEAAARFELWVVTAPQDGGELRRDVAFPSDQTARLHTTEWVAFAKKGLVDRFRVVLVNETGDTLVLDSGRSVALDAGKWKAFAVATADVDDQTLTAAAKEAGVEAKSLKLPNHPGEQVSGVLIVQP